MKNRKVIKKYREDKLPSSLITLTKVTKVSKIIAENKTYLEPFPAQSMIGRIISWIRSKLSFTKSLFLLDSEVKLRYDILTQEVSDEYPSETD